MKQNSFSPRALFGFTGAFLAAGAALACFYWKTDAAEFMLRHAFYQSFAFLNGLPAPQTNMILPAYNPLKDLPFWYAVQTDGWTAARTLWGILAGGCLGAFFAGARKLFDEDADFSAFICLVLLAGLSLWRTQMGAYANLLIPATAVFAALFILLSGKQSPARAFAAGLLCGAAAGLATPWLYGTAALLIFTAVRPGSSRTAAFVFTAGCAAGAAAVLSPWIYALYTGGYGVTPAGWLAGLETVSLAGTGENVWAMSVCFAAPVLTCLFRRKNSGPKPLLFYYSFALSVTWTAACLTARALSEGGRFFPSPDAGFALCMLSLPALTGLVYRSRSKAGQFAAGLLCAAFLCYSPNGTDQMQLETNRFLEAGFPYRPEPKDAVLIDGPEAAWTAVFLPPGVTATQNPRDKALRRAGTVYLLSAKPYEWSDPEEPMHPRYTAPDPEEPSVPATDTGLELEEPCRPVLTNRSAARGFAPLMCKLRPAAKNKRARASGSVPVLK